MTGRSLALFWLMSESNKQLSWGTVRADQLFLVIYLCKASFLRRQWKLSSWKGWFPHLLKEHLSKAKKILAVRWAKKTGRKESHIFKNRCIYIQRIKKKQSTREECFNKYHIQDSHLAPGSLEKMLPSCPSHVYACIVSFVFCFLTGFLLLWIDGFLLSEI